MPNVSLQTKSKSALLPPGTATPTKTRVQLWLNGGLAAENFIPLGGKQNYPNMGDGLYTVKTLNMAADNTPVGNEASQDVQIVDGVVVPVADGVDVIYEPV